MTVPSGIDHRREESGRLFARAFAFIFWLIAVLLFGFVEWLIFWTIKRARRPRSRAAGR